MKRIAFFRIFHQNGAHFKILQSNIFVYWTKSINNQISSHKFNFYAHIGHGLYTRNYGIITSIISVKKPTKKKMSFDKYMN